MILPQPEVLCQSDPLHTGIGHLYEVFFYAELLCFYDASIVSTPTHPPAIQRRRAMSRKTRTSRMAGNQSLRSPRAAPKGGNNTLTGLRQLLAASEKEKAALAKELGKARREAERTNLTVQRELITARPSQTSAAAAGDSAATAAAINLTIDDDDDDVLSTDDAAAELRRVTSGASAGSSDTLYGLPGPDDHEHGAECE